MENKNKLVIFDWGGIVESHKNGEYNCFEANADIINTFIKNQMSVNEIISKFRECIYDDNGTNIEEINTESGVKNWIDKIKKTFNFECEYSEFYNVYQEKFDKVKYYKDVVQFAHSLKNKCKIGILSNLCALDKNRIDKQYNLSKFDYVWLSFEMGCKKPKDEIYIKVENDSKIKPNNILFIDDVMENLIPAQKRGWNICNAAGYELDKIKKSVEDFFIL